MNAKFLLPGLSLLLLCSSAATFAGDSRSHGPSHYQGWYDNRPDRHWHEFLRHRDLRQDHWHGVPLHRNGSRAPGWHHERFYHSPYDRDGATIIFRGR